MRIEQKQAKCQNQSVRPLCFVMRQVHVEYLSRTCDIVVVVRSSVTIVAHLCVVVSILVCMYTPKTNMKSEIRSLKHGYPRNDTNPWYKKILVRVTLV